MDKKVYRNKACRCSICGDYASECAGCGKDLEEGEELIHYEDDFGERDHFHKKCG